MYLQQTYITYKKTATVARKTTYNYHIDRYAHQDSGYVTGEQYDLIFILNLQTRVSSILYWGQENQQMLVAVGICFLATAILVAAAIVFLLRNRYVARQKLKDLTQPTDTEATRDYQVLY